VRTAYNPATLARYNRGDSGNSPNAKYYGIDKRENVKYAKGQMGQDWNRVKPHPNGASPSNVIAGSRYSGRSLGHPAVFPEYLPRFFIDAMTKTGDLVFDPFSGSGMTAVASLKLDRHFLGCDLSETYVNLALKRLSEVQKEMKT
jgi:DNA modification methylase